MQCPRLTDGALTGRSQTPQQHHAVTMLKGLLRRSGLGFSRARELSSRQQVLECGAFKFEGKTLKRQSRPSMFHGMKIIASLQKPQAEMARLTLPRIPPLLVPKLWYGLSAAGAVCLLPYIALWLKNGLGLSDGQIGIVSALRPWVSSVAMLLLPALADTWTCHRTMLVGCFVVSTALRCSMWLLAGQSASSMTIVTALILADLVGAPIGPMVDSMVVTACKQEGSSYGRQRLWASVGWGVLSIPSGLLIERFGTGAGFVAFAALSLPCLLILFGFKYPAANKPADMSEDMAYQALDATPDVSKQTTPVATVVSATRSSDLSSRDQNSARIRRDATGSTRGDSMAVSVNASPAEGALSSWHDIVQDHLPVHSMSDSAAYGLDCDSTAPESSVDSAKLSVNGKGSALPDNASMSDKMKELFQNPMVWLFLWQCLIMGCAGAGLIGTYAFLFLTDLGATTTFLGMILAVNCIMEVLVFQQQDAILSRFTPQRMLHLSQGALVLRLLAYAVAPNTWAVLVADTLQGITFAGGWAACCIRAKELAPVGLEATMQGLLTAVYFGVGAGGGCMLGGFLLDAKLGWSTTWTACAAFVAVGWAVSLAAGKVLQAKQPLVPAAQNVPRVKRQLYRRE